MAPAFKYDGGTGNSVRDDDFFGTNALAGSSDNLVARTEDEANVIRDGNDVLLKQFEMKMIKREYSRNQTSRGNKVSAAGAMTLAGVDWLGFPAAAHIAPSGESTAAERKSPRERRRKSLHTFPSDDEEIIVLHHRRYHHHRDGHESRHPVSQRRLSQRGVERAASADSALSPRQLSPRQLPPRQMSPRQLSPRQASPSCRNRRTSKKNGMSQTSDVGVVTRPSGSCASRRRSLDQGGSNGNGSVLHGGNGSGNGSGSYHRSFRNRRTTPGERGERQQRPRSEKTFSSTRVQRQHSSGVVASPPIVRSESPSTTRRRKSTSPHASKRGLAAASATTLDTGRKSTSQSRRCRGLNLENNSGIFMGSELKKQSSIRW